MGTICWNDVHLQYGSEVHFSHHLGYVDRLFSKWVGSFDPLVQTKFSCWSPNKLDTKNLEAFRTIESYLSQNLSLQSRRLKANSVKDIESPVLTSDEGEVMTDVFHGVKFWWVPGTEISSNSSSNFSSPGVSKDDQKQSYYILSFYKKYRETVFKDYLKHVMEEGKKIEARNRQLSLFVNPKDWVYWKEVKFNSPSTFQTLEMEQRKKEEIMEDLLWFSKSREYYRQIGKVWKRGYLLYGPPGTGKSTMICSIANLLGYHIYNLELSAVRYNSDLTALLIQIPAKSIMVIENIDCSIDITGKRDVAGNGNGRKGNENVTLWGLLNMVDGFFSAIDGERLIVFTTNHKEKLDPALIRKGRMDVHVEMLYCGFDGFKVLAKNYLGVDWHETYDRIEQLLGKDHVKITPADVAELLMVKRVDMNLGTVLGSLVSVLEKKRASKRSIPSTYGKNGG